MGSGTSYKVEASRQKTTNEPLREALDSNEASDFTSDVISAKRYKPRYALRLEVLHFRVTQTCQGKHLAMFSSKMPNWFTLEPLICYYSFINHISLVINLLDSISQTPFHILKCVHSIFISHTYLFLSLGCLFFFLIVSSHR